MPDGVISRALRRKCHRLSIRSNQQIMNDAQQKQSAKILFLVMMLSFLHYLKKAKFYSSTYLYAWLTVHHLQFRFISFPT
jgi:hypothetical protein